MICCIYLHAVIRDFFSVIPANAGVILCSGASEHSRLGYPRECGGDPIFDVLEKAVRELSPRMRG